MAKIHDIMFEFGAKLQNTVPQAFNTMNKVVTETGAKIAQLSKNNPFSSMKNVDELKRAFDTAKAKQESLAAGFNRLTDRTQNMQYKFANATGKVKLLSEEIGKAGTPTNEQARRLGKARQQAGYFQNQLIDLRQELNNSSNELKKQSNVVKELGDQYNRQAAKAKNAEIIRSHREKVSQSLLDANNSFAIARTTVLSASFMVEPIKQAMKFESVMADIRKLVHFDTPQEFAQMGEQLKQLSTRVPMAVDGLGHIAAAAAQAGIAKQDIMQFTENAAQMGVAYNISAEQAGDMMAKWRSAFKLNQNQVVKLADQINILSDNSAASGVQIGEVVSRIGSLGKIAGIAESEVAALAATSIGAGVAPEIAATGIKKMMTTLTSGTAATKGQAEAMGKLGINVVKLSKDLQAQGVPAMLNVLDKIKQLPKEVQSSTLKQIFGEESIAPIAGLMNNLDEVRKNLGLVGDSSKYAGSMMKEFNARSATTENSLQLFKNNLSAIAITMGNTFLPPINQAIKDINDLLQNSIVPFIAAHSDAIFTIGKFGACIVAVVASIAVTKAAFSSLNAVWVVGTGALKLLSNSLLWFIPIQMRAAFATKLMSYWQGVSNALMRLNPIIAIARAIIALGVGIYWVCTHWETFTGWLKKAWDMIKEVFGWVEKLSGAVASLFDGNDGKKKLEIDYELKNSSRFAGNVETLATNQKERALANKPNMTLNSNPTVIIQGDANKNDIKIAMAEAQEKQKNEFSNLWGNARFSN
ncbi:MAG: phage tail tape measure protein [Neisseriales bacterium]|nr:MAG: phage tail tape measure protein [Neisseriales bacterium]